MDFEGFCEDENRTTLSEDYHPIQDGWNSLLDVIGDDPQFLYVWALPLWNYALYWSIGSLFVLMDVTGKPAFLRKYKTQPGRNEPLPTKALSSVVFSVLFNQFCMGIPAAFIGFRLIDTSSLENIRILPSGFVVLRDLIVCIILIEPVFYYAHRIVHLGPIYRHIHKRHHEWTAPFALEALHCTPPEYVLFNVIVPSVGIVLMKSHVFTAALWYPVMVMNTLRDHCGYHLPFFFSPEFHDYHHAKFTECYGIYGIMDWLHATDRKYRKSKQHQRHHVLWTTKSARELVPDK
ncbi:fatty acid hydroxylase domain-containing protein 2-like [Uranotaenia lowii]|uniref:fatty acid hydroxylase domain-containing protein 2-like n=1 Tax=Uranotaenia lowii TaxID=190385 RepID=UPI00247AA785|nr:fatty acid hydroxylase domain-containing protein 2-like [Uranotaenia lowii]